MVLAFLRFGYLGLGYGVICLCATVLDFSFGDSKIEHAFCTNRLCFEITLCHRNIIFRYVQLDLAILVVCPAWFTGGLPNPVLVVDWLHLVNLLFLQSRVHSC